MVFYNCTVLYFCSNKCSHDERKVLLSNTFKNPTNPKRLNSSVIKSHNVDLCYF